MTNFAKKEFKFCPLNLLVYCVYYTHKQNFCGKEIDLFAR